MGHDDAPNATHWLPWQHPFGHDVALHAQLPLTHCWPAAQLLPVEPHWQPLPLQASLTKVLQLVHELPLTPHEGNVELAPVQVVLSEQHPPQPLVVLQVHVPPTHTRP